LAEGKKFGKIDKGAILPLPTISRIATHATPFQQVLFLKRFSKAKFGARWQQSANFTFQTSATPLRQKVL
jgi:hypothetical protein